MNKKEYFAPTVDIVVLEKADVITASGEPFKSKPFQSKEDSFTNEFDS